MAFKDELVEIIQMAQQEQEEDARAGGEFARGWEALRRGAILDVLKEAKPVLTERCGGADCHLPNGSIVLEAGYEHKSKRFKHSLTFKPDNQKRQVVCASSFESMPETFDLDQLTREVVEDRVRRFTYAAAGGTGQLPSMSVYDQRLRQGKPVLHVIGD